MVRAHPRHELYPVLRKPCRGVALLRPLEVIQHGTVVPAFAGVDDAQAHLAPQPGGLPRMTLLEGFCRLEHVVACPPQLVIGAPVGQLGEARGFLRLNQERDQRRKRAAVVLNGRIDCL